MSNDRYSLSGSSPEPHSEPQILLPQTTLTPEQIVEGFCRMYDRKANEIYLVFSKDKKSHARQAHDKSKPWVTKICKHAELVAKEYGGVVLTLEEAIKLMVSQELKKHN